MISVIIPIYNQHEMSTDCINVVRENMDGLDYEFVIIDNGSEPAFKPPFTGHVETLLIRNEENAGFPVAANQGIRAARGETIILLNNDVIVTPGWAHKITEWLDEISIIGVLSNFCAGVQQTAVGDYNNRDELDKRAEEVAEAYRGQALAVRYVIGFVMAFRKPLYDEIGPFDESLWPCSGEEVDFCYKARAAGYTVGVAQDIYVHHHGSKTFGDLVNAGVLDYGEIAKRNDDHLAEKWGPDVMSGQLDLGRRDVGKSEGVRLNLGCGHFKLDGFINIDQFEDVNPDVVADVTKLTYGPNTVDEIYCGHLLEHLEWQEGQEALKHWLYILKSGGEIRIVVPNFDFFAVDYLENPTAEAMKRLNDYEMYSYVQESPHKYFYSESLLEFAMTEAGFVNIEMLAANHPYFTEQRDWQIGFVGVKP